MISISIDYFLQASSSCICHIPYPYKDNNLNRRLPTNDLAEAVMPPFIVNTLKPWYNEQVRHTLFRAISISRVALLILSRMLELSVSNLVKKQKKI